MNIIDSSGGVSPFPTIPVVSFCFFRSAGISFLSGYLFFGRQFEIRGSFFFLREQFPFAAAVVSVESQGRFETHSNDV